MRRRRIEMRMIGGERMCVVLPLQLVLVLNADVRGQSPIKKSVPGRSMCPSHVHPDRIAGLVSFLNYPYLTVVRIIL